MPRLAWLTFEEGQARPQQNVKGNSMSMLKHVKGWTPWTVVTVLTMPMLGCASGSSPNAICDGTASLRDVHTEALIEDGGESSIVSGAALIAALDAGCAQ